jgi:NAD-dependent dihydropyrimidine dehydrogenase PreA subunit
MPPEIDYDKCIGCGKCIDVCAEDVFFVAEEPGKGKREKPVVTYPEACWHGYSCVKECPVEGAIWLRIPLALFVAYK